MRPTFVPAEQRNSCRGMTLSSGSIGPMCYSLPRASHQQLDQANQQANQPAPTAKSAMSSEPKAAQIHLEKLNAGVLAHPRVQTRTKRQAPWHSSANEAKAAGRRCEYAHVVAASGTWSDKVLSWLTSGSSVVRCTIWTALSVKLLRRVIYCVVRAFAQFTPAVCLCASGSKVIGSFGPAAFAFSLQFLKTNFLSWILNVI